MEKNDSLQSKKSAIGDSGHSSLAKGDTDYLSGKYLSGKRVLSYSHQLAELLPMRPANVLEIGVGPGIVTSCLRQVGVTVITFDLDPTLRPNVMGNVTNMPFRDQAFQTALCCQVLEHLPFENFRYVLAELSRIVSNVLILSLPDMSYYFKFSIVLPLIRRRSCSFCIGTGRTVPAHRMTKSGHFWEIGYRGFSLRKIRKEIVSSGWTIKKTWRVPEFLYHRFFFLSNEK